MASRTIFFTVRAGGALKVAGEFAGTLVGAKIRIYVSLTLTT